MATSRITIDSKIMMGKPVIKGTRITVEAVLKKLSQKISAQEIIREYPGLTEKDISAALEYAAASIKNEEVYPLAKQ